MPEPTASTKSTAFAGSPRPKANATNAADFSAAMRDEVIASVKQAQQLTIDAVTTWVDVFGKLVPELPALPFVPARSDVVEGLGMVFEMAEELMASERRFASELVNVLVPAS
jgi:hypothetical protein